MVIDLLAESLEDILTSRGTPFSMKTVLMLADQMLSRLEWLHKHHIMHRDIKPDNFMLGTGGLASRVYLIDFGLSKRFEDSRTRAHIPFVTGKNLTGTARYASINAMRGCEQSRRDDLEAVGYVWIYLLKATLPWQGIPAKTQKEKLERILLVKSETSIETLCEGLPEEFADFFTKVKQLEFEEEPEYSDYRKAFRQLFLRQGYVYDGVYDWTGEGVQGETKGRAGDGTGSADMAPAPRIAKRPHVMLVPPGTAKAILPVLPVLPSAQWQQPQGASRRYGYPSKTPQISPRPAPEVRTRVVLPVLVH
jgi:serine/threonine protein kinase